MLHSLPFLAVLGSPHSMPSYLLIHRRLAVAPHDPLRMSVLHGPLPILSCQATVRGSLHTILKMLRSIQLPGFSMAWNTSRRYCRRLCSNEAVSRSCFNSTDLPFPRQALPTPKAISFVECRAIRPEQRQKKVA